MSATALSYLGWAFLPDLATNWLQTILYAIFIRAGEPKPQPGSPRFVLHRQRLYITVILAYLAYSLYEAHWEIVRASDAYAMLGLPPYADDRAISSRFRKLTLQYHPDKVNPSAAQRPAVEAFYTTLLHAREILADPVKRFAYDRFGPQMEAWKCVTVADYVTTGLRALAPYYLASAAALFAFGYVGLLQWGTYWRWLAFAAVGLLEVRLLTRVDTALLPAATPDLPAPLAALLPRAYLPFQLLQFAHKAAISLFVALSRIGPILEAMSMPGTTPNTGSAEQQTARSLERLQQQLAAGHMETARHLAFEAVPFSGLGALPAQQEAARARELAVLERGLREWILLNSLRSDDEVKRAIQTAVDVSRRPAAESS